MRKQFLGTIGLIAAIGLAAAATPAFTAETNASLSVTVTAQPSAVACVMFAASPGTQIDFGTLPFSQDANSPVGLALGPTRPRFSNCGTAREDIFIAGSPAHNVCAPSCTSHTWALGGAEAECPALDSYQLWYYVDGNGIDIGGASLRTTNIPLRKAPNGSYSYAPNEARDLGLQIKMPCRGSAGAGEAFSLSVTVMAAVP